MKNLYHHGNLKEELLNVAFEFIKKHGEQDLTLRYLAEQTNTSRSAIYRHFKSKDELIENIIIVGLDIFDARVTEPMLDQKLNLFDKFYYSGKAYIEFAKEYPNLYRLIFGEKYSHIREGVRRIGDESCYGFNVLKELVESGQKAGVIKNENSYYQSIIIWSALHGFASLIIDGFRDVASIDDILYEKHFKTLLYGHLTDKAKEQL
jgi:AcrR family transcriptional regulator